MGKCSFNPKWLLKTDSSGYILSSWAKKKDDKNLWCVVCEASVGVSKGFQAVEQHYKCGKHIANIKTKLESKQLRLAGVAESSKESNSVTPAHLSLFSSADKVVKAELIWTMKCIVSNYSAKSCNGTTEVFKSMFPEAVLDDFCLSANKFSYLVTEALGPYFKSKMLEDAYTSYFSVLFDETTNNESRKELQIAIKYWSKRQNEIILMHLDTVFIGGATAEDLSSNILNCLDKSALSLNKLIMIGSDGPPVNAKVFRIINEEVKAMPGREKGLLQVGTCNLHVINNAFLKSLEAYGSDVSELILGLYYFFHGWPSRIEEYENIQRKKNVPMHRFIKHSSIRWLTLEGAVSRVLEQWPAIMHFFLEYLPMKKNQKFLNMNCYKKMHNLLSDKSMKIQLIFILSSAQLFAKYSIMFQKEEPLVHILYSGLKDLLITIMKRVCKNNLVEKMMQSEEFENAFNEENLLLSKDIICGAAVIAELREMPEKYHKEFLSNARSHYIQGGKYLVSKIFQNHNNLKYFSFLNFNEIGKEDSCSNIVKIAMALPGSVNTNMLIDEWHLLQSEELPSASDVRIDHVWRKVFGIKNAMGETKYPIIQDVVKKCLAVSHGSADVERGFSNSRRIISEDRTQMLERTLNSKLHVLGALKFYDYKPNLVPMTKELLASARGAYSKYKLYLEEERKKKEMLLKKDEEEKRKLEEENNEKKAIEKNFKNISELETELVEARKVESAKEKVSDKLLKEANDRLKEGIKNQDFKEIQLAQAMLEGVKTVKEQENAQREKTTSIEKKLQKRKSIVLKKFVKKSRTE